MSASSPKNPSLCALPFLQFNVQPTGQATLCCVSGEPLRGENGEELSILTHSFDEIWQSPTLREVRKKMLAGEPVARCAGCLIPAARQSSYRDEMNYKLLRRDADGDYPVTFADRFLDLAEKFDWLKPGFSASIDELQEAATGEPRSFDLRVDNKCNLKCVICSQYWSSQIEADPVHSVWADPGVSTKVEHNRFGDSRHWARSTELLDEVLAFGKSAEYVQMAGGEPFASRVCLAWMKDMVATGQSRNVDLKIFTNAQHLSTEIVESLSQFRSVVVVLSIDAYGDQYEYVRFPGKWKRIEANAEHIKSLKTRLPGRFEVYINFTLSAYTALYARSLVQWAWDNGIKVMLTYAIYPTYVSTLNLPPRLKSKVILRLQELSAEFEERMPYLPWFVEGLIADLKEAEFNHEQAVSFMHFTNDMNRSRGLYFAGTFPELYEEYVHWYGRWADSEWRARDIIRYPRWAMREGPRAVGRLVVGVPYRAGRLARRMLGGYGLLGLIREARSRAYHLVRRIPGVPGLRSRMKRLLFGAEVRT